MLNQGRQNKGLVLARHERDFEAAGETTLDPREWLAALRADDGESQRDRRAAIAHCLSGTEGWRAAATRAGGAFAGGSAATGLIGRKE